MLDPALSLLSVVEKARSYGFATLQICENARPMDLGESQWAEVVQRAKEIGIEIQLGWWVALGRGAY